MQPSGVVHPLRDLKKQPQILRPEVQAAIWPAEVEAAVLAQLALRVFARVPPKMLARFTDAHTAEPAFPPFPKIGEASLDRTVVHFRGVLAQGAAKRAQRRRGIRADGDDEGDGLEHRARDMFGMDGDENRS